MCFPDKNEMKLSMKDDDIKISEVHFSRNFLLGSTQS